MIQILKRNHFYNFDVNSNKMIVSLIWKTPHLVKELLSIIFILSRPFFSNVLFCSIKYLYWAHKMLKADNKAEYRVVEAVEIVIYIQNLEIKSMVSRKSA